MDLWYNRTAANGNTQSGAKQALLDPLESSFSAAGLLTVFRRDNSFTEFSEASRGLRTAITWGQAKCPQLTVGADFNQLDNRLVENFGDFAVPLVAAAGLPHQEFQVLGVPGGHATDPGVFADVVLPLGDCLVVKAGFRADWVWTSSSNRFIPAGGGLDSFDPIVFSTDPNDNHLARLFSLWSAYITSEYKLAEHLTAQAGIANAERPPTLTELYATGPFVATLQQGLNRLNGDPHLAPEVNRQVDLGLRADYECFRAGANSFFSWVHNYITYDAQRILGTGFSQVTFTNTNEATLWGGEIYGEFDATDWLTPFGTLTYVDGEDETHVDNRRNFLITNGNFSGMLPTIGSTRSSITTPPATTHEPLPGIAPLDSRLGFRVHEPGKSPRYSVEFTARIVADQERVATSLGELRTPGFTTYDVRGYWQATHNLLLTAGVENIGDIMYREHLDPRVGDQFWRPGINFYCGVQLQY